MKIKRIISQNRRDFTAIYECEHCAHEREGYGYDDAHFHQNVIPKMECKECGKTASADYLAAGNEVSARDAGMSNTSERVKRMLREHLGLQDDVSLEPGTHFIDDLGADSLDAIELCMTAEDEFDIEIDEAAAIRIETVGDMIAAVDERKGEDSC